jgi:D-3-phosphoglycerate dehydrogenase
MMYRIKTYNQIAQVGLDQFDKDKYQVSAETENPDAILLRSAKLHDLEFNPELLAIGRAGVGVNNIPIDRCNEAGIVVFNTPGANANAVKELVLAGMLLSSRSIVDGIEWVKSLKGTEDVPGQVEKSKAQFTGPEIGGKTLGVIGLGAIGVRVANVAAMLEMHVLGYDPYMSINAAWNLNRSVNRAITLEEIYEQSDYITLHVPLTETTNQMLNEKAFAAMKPGMHILNFSRSELVDYDALRKYIDNGTVVSYVTDFPGEEVLDMQNTICIPHLGASTPESEENCAVMAAKELKDYLENGNISNSVNLPSVELPKNFKARVCIIHKNVPSVLTQLSGVMSKIRVNIENMINKSRGDYAYTILDVAADVTPDTEEALKKIDNVIRVRVIQ